MDCRCVCNQFNKPIDTAWQQYPRLTQLNHNTSRKQLKISQETSTTQLFFRQFNKDLSNRLSMEFITKPSMILTRCSDSSRKGATLGSPSLALTFWPSWSIIAVPASSNNSHTHTKTNYPWPSWTWMLPKSWKSTLKSSHLLFTWLVLWVLSLNRAGLRT